MELEQLRQIDAVARAGTTSAAAAELHISQPALSRSIQRLEAEFGSPLFDREGRRVRLNEVGAVAVEWARQLLRDEALPREAAGAAAEPLRLDLRRKGHRDLVLVDAEGEENVFADR